MNVDSAAALQQWVLQRLDEITPEGSEQSVPAAVITNELDEAARDVVLQAPAALLSACAKSGVADANQVAFVRSITDEDGNEISKSLLVPLAHEAVRVLRFQVVGWTVPLREAELFTEEGGSYAALLAAEIVATVRNPAAALRLYTDPDTIDPATRRNLAIEAWPVTGVAADSDAPVAELVYVPELRTDAVPTDLQDVMVWIAVQRICDGYLKDYAAAQAAQGHAERSFEARLSRFARLSGSPHVQKVFKRPYRPY